MGRVLLDQYAGQREYLHLDAADGSFAIETVGEVAGTLAANAQRRSAGDGYSSSRELRHVASIPPVVQLIWIRRYGADPLAPGNGDLLRRVLNSSEWSLLRTSEGRL